jgi:hypothetical protein
MKSKINDLGCIPQCGNAFFHMTNFAAAQRRDFFIMRNVQYRHVKRTPGEVGLGPGPNSRMYPR